MTESRRTAVIAGAAAVFAVLTWLTSPRASVSEVFADRGEAFFPELTDPNTATSLEVVEFDEQTATARPFKVSNRGGRWTIPSHHDYPADGQQRLAQTAAAVIALRKDDLASENPSDHERLGVLDPLDEALPAPGGRGTRLTVKGTNERLLADVIVGRPVEQRPRFRYVRVPGQSRAYVANVGDLTISTSFGDWIDRDLLQVDRHDIDAVIVRDYSLDRDTGRVDLREVVQLTAVGRDKWVLEGQAAGEQINTFNMNLLVTKLDELAIVDVQPKPPTVTAMLSSRDGAGTLPRDEAADLGRKGFYFTRDGQLLSNQGEVLVHTRSGIFYTLRFGELVYGHGTGDASPGVERPVASAENRYLFISVGLDDRAAASEAGREAARERLDLLRTRFAPWYYVISADSFDKIRLARRQLVQAPS